MKKKKKNKGSEKMNNENQQNTTNINWYPRTYGKNEETNYRRLEIS